MSRTIAIITTLMLLAACGDPGTGGSGVPNGSVAAAGQATDGNNNSVTSPAPIPGVQTSPTATTAGPARVEACSKIEPTIAQGLYGCIGYYGDLGASQSDVQGDFAVALYDGVSAPTATSNSMAIARTVSDSKGFYELAAPTGTFWLCSSSFRCTAVTITAGLKLRQNYFGGSGPGW